jgi:hypothetical protein
MLLEVYSSLRGGIVAGVWVFKADPRGPKTTDLV